MRRQQVRRALPGHLKSWDVPAPPPAPRAPDLRMTKEVHGGKLNELAQHTPLCTELVLELGPREVVKKQREQLHPIRVDDGGPSGGMCRAQVDADAVSLADDRPHHQIQLACVCRHSVVHFLRSHARRLRWRP